MTSQTDQDWAHSLLRQFPCTRSCSSLCWKNRCGAVHCQQVFYDRSLHVLPVNIFQKIINREIPAKIIHEDDISLAFHDINAQAPVHVLIIPKKVIRTHDDIGVEDQATLGHLHLVAQKLARQLNLTEGYRLVLNCKEQAGQTVPHLHMHLLGGRDLAWPPG
ncbi:MAG: histidine triad nucleotide-binding protein [Planctomycetia bacterium]|nr:histidine triad nucleotide-binding protein [Planctomycetia bacterium]